MKEQLTFERRIWIASWAVANNLDFEKLKHSDYMYGHESETQDVWHFVKECRNNGIIWFYETYRQYKLYSI